MPARIDALGEVVAGLAGEPAGDGGVIGGGAGEGLGGEPAAERDLGAAGGLDRRQQRRVVGGLDHHGDTVVVLGGGADHGRAADVDLLDAGGEVGARGERGLERVEVDHDQVDRRDAVLAPASPGARHRRGGRGCRRGRRDAGS